MSINIKRKHLIDLSIFSIWYAIGLIVAIYIFSSYSKHRREINGIVYDAMQDIIYKIEPYYQLHSRVSNNDEFIREINNVRMLSGRLWYSKRRLDKHDNTEDHNIIKDSWDNKVMFVISSEGIVAFVSYGPNRTWDRLRYDDQLLPLAVK